MDKYKKLQEILHKHPTGAPESKAFDDILRLLFTPEEVDVALGMVFVPRTINEITKMVSRAGAEKGRLDDFLTVMKR